MNYDDYQDLSDEQAIEIYNEEMAEMDSDYDEDQAEINWQLFEAETTISVADLPACP